MMEYNTARKKSPKKDTAQRTNTTQNTTLTSSYILHICNRVVYRLETKLKQYVVKRGLTSTIGNIMMRLRRYLLFSQCPFHVGMLFWPFVIAALPLPLRILGCFLLN